MVGMPPRRRDPGRVVRPGRRPGVSEGREIVMAKHRFAERKLEAIRVDEAIDPICGHEGGAVELAYGLRYVNPHQAITRAVAAADSAARLGCTRCLGRARVAAGASRFRLVDPHAEADLQHALETFVSGPDPLWAARARMWLGMIARRGTDFDLSLRLFGDALEGFWTAADRRGEGEVLVMIGTQQMLIGNFVDALAMFEESRRIFEEVGDAEGVGLSANDTGIAWAELGEFASSRRSFEEALALFRSVGADSIIIPTLSNLGITCSELGEPERGLAYLHESLSRCRDAGERWPEARVLLNLGRVHHRLEDHDRAREYFERAMALSHEIGERRTELDARIALARELLHRGEIDGSGAMLEAALAAAQDGGIQRIIVEAHDALAERHEQAGDASAALRHLRLADATRRQIKAAGAELHLRHLASFAALKQAHQQAQLQLLKAQLQPHFLFNALHSLTELIDRDAERATRMVIHLAQLLRLSLDQSTAQTTTLAAEVEFVSAYLEMECVRYPGRFGYVIDVEPGLGAAKVPHLLLQPLAENAIRHGFREDGDGARLEIRAGRADPDRLVLVVSDNGKGLRAGWSLEQSGFGLRNTRMRLQQLHGAEHRFSIGSAHGGGTRVEIALPLHF
jgi:tetratricopeptide (TPR) repeat protein